MRNLDPSHYIDPAIHAADVERIFARTWQLIGPASRLAARGDYIATEIAGQKVFFIRAADGIRLSVMSAATAARGCCQKGRAAAPPSAAPIINGSGARTDRC